SWRAPEPSRRATHTVEVVTDGDSYTPNTSHSPDGDHAGYPTSAFTTISASRDSTSTTYTPLSAGSSHVAATATSPPAGDNDPPYNRQPTISANTSGSPVSRSTIAAPTNEVSIPRYVNTTRDSSTGTAQSNRPEGTSTLDVDPSSPTTSNAGSIASST